MTGSSGWISSPDEDNDGWYDYNCKCNWTIEVDPSKHILFQILYVWTDPYQKQNGTTAVNTADSNLPHNDGSDKDYYNLHNSCVDRLQVHVIC